MHEVGGEKLLSVQTLLLHCLLHRAWIGWLDFHTVESELLGTDTPRKQTQKKTPQSKQFIEFMITSSSPTSGVVLAIQVYSRIYIYILIKAIILLVCRRIACVFTKTYLPEWHPASVRGHWGRGYCLQPLGICVSDSVFVRYLLLLHLPLLKG